MPVEVRSGNPSRQPSRSTRALVAAGCCECGEGRRRRGRSSRERSSRSQVCASCSSPSTISPTCTQASPSALPIARATTLSTAPCSRASARRAKACQSQRAPAGCPVSGGLPPSASLEHRCRAPQQGGVLLGARARDEDAPRPRPRAARRPRRARSMSRALRSTMKSSPRCAHSASPPSRCTHTATGTASLRCRSAQVMSHNSAGVK